MKNIFISLLLICMLFLYASFGYTNGLAKIEIKANKEEIRTGDKLIVYIEIKNCTDKPMTLYKYLLPYLGVNFYNEDGEIIPISFLEVYVYNEEGEAIPMSCDTALSLSMDSYVFLKKEGYKELQPNEVYKYVAEFELIQGEYEVKKMKYRGLFLRHGGYYLFLGDTKKILVQTHFNKAFYEGIITKGEKLGFRNIFGEELTSNIVTINIVD